jgi:hypothetical protein
VIGLEKENKIGTEKENAVAHPLWRDGWLTPPAQGVRMLTVNHLAHIREARWDGQTIRQIAHEFSASSKRLSSRFWPTPNRSATRCPSLSVRSLPPGLDASLAGDALALRKQRHTAAQIDRRLRAEHG